MPQRQKFLGLLGVVALVILALTLINAAKISAQGPGDWPCNDDDGTIQHGPGMMGGRGHHGMMGDFDCDDQTQFGPGMMNGFGHHGMMGDFDDNDQTQFGPGMMNGFGHHGMMGDFDWETFSPMWQGMMRNHPMWNGSNTDSDFSGMWNHSMMQAWTPCADLLPAETPFDLDTASTIATAYIANWDDDNLVLGEVMAFGNHFYATALESDTGRGAFEFLIDPESGIVYAEHGPNMMWNLKYGQHVGMGYGMMGAFTTDEDGVEMTIPEAEAVTLAQEFLTDLNEDYVAATDDIEAFYGYYTLHITQNDDIIGMLSVNGYTGQVWLHGWHGEFIGMMSHR